MFDQQQTKRIAEEKDLRRVAWRVLADLSAFIADNRPEDDLDLSVEYGPTPTSHRIVLARSQETSLEITCDSSTVFQLRKCETPRQVKSGPSAADYNTKMWSVEELGLRVTEWLDETKRTGPHQVSPPA